MELKELYGGVLLILLGVCIHLFPNLIKKFDAFLNKRKVNIRLEHSYKIMGNALIALGISIIVMRCLFSYLMLDAIADAVIPVFVPVFIVIVGILLTFPALMKKD